MAPRQARKRNGRVLTLFGTLAGAAIGAAVGLVYTPAGGEENRKRLNSWANNRMQELENKAKEKLSGTTDLRPEKDN